MCPYDLWEQSELILRLTGSNVIQLEHFPIWRRRRFSAAEPPKRAKIVIFAYFGSKKRKKSKKKKNLFSIATVRELTLARKKNASGTQRLLQARSLLRAPKARALRAERRRREDFRSPAGVNYFIARAKTRSEGRLRSPVGANTMYSITRRGFRAPQARV